MKFPLFALVAVVLAAPSAHASYFARCHFDVDVETVQPGMRIIGGTILTRAVKGKVVTAKDNGPSHVKCADKFQGKTFEFTLQLKNDDKNGAYKKIWAVKNKSAIKVDYNAWSGLSPEGVTEAEDWALMP